MPGKLAFLFLTVLGLRGKVLVAGMASVSRAQQYSISEQSCSKRDPPLPELSHELCLVRSGRGDLRKGETAVQQKLGERN